eukprot:12999063-Alexandrium_andersonii.AAC.1
MPRTPRREGAATSGGTGPGQCLAAGLWWDGRRPPGPEAGRGQSQCLWHAFLPHGAPLGDPRAPHLPT